MTTPLMGRLPKGADLLEALTALCEETNITKAQLQCIGALEGATLGYYLQKEREYISYDVKEHVEIVAGMGNIALKDGKPFVHLHLTRSRKDGSCIGGHAMPGIPIFVCEYIITPLPGEPLHRAYDDDTGLILLPENS